jgi:hypothetical protein
MGNLREAIAEYAAEARLRRIEQYNLGKYKKSLSWASMQNYFNFCILEIQTDNQTMIINKPQYKLIAEYLKSEAFNTEKASVGAPA